MLAGGLATLVREKLAGVVTPDAEAVTLYGPPTLPLAVKMAAVATPCALVVAVFTLPAKVPLAPVPGAANVTVTPLTGLLRESLTVACRDVANGVLIVVLCGVPAVAAIVAAVPPVPMVALNAANTTPQLPDAANDPPAEAVP